MIFRLLLLIILMTACGKVDLGNIDNLNNGIVHIIGHGGMGFQGTDNSIPENSYSALRKAVIGLNSDGVETDVQLSSDNKLILYHNGRLHETTSCTGCPIERSQNYINQCLYRNNRYFNRYTTEKVISPNDIVSIFSKLKKKPYVYLDVKVDSPCTLPTSFATYINNYANALVNLIQNYSAQNWIIVTSKSESLLNEIQGIDSTIKLYYENTDPNVAIITANNNSYSGVTLDYATTNATYASNAHGYNLRVVLFGVKSRESTVAALKTNPDAIMTDNIILMQRILMSR